MSKLQLEVIYAGDHNLSCFYMAEVVRVVVSAFEKDQVTWKTVQLFTKDGARRFYELSVALYGEEQVRKGYCHAPIPSIFINGKLVYDHIPCIEELDATIRRLLEEGQG